MGGAVIGARELIDQIKVGPLHHAGGAISPFNVWLIMRGSVTLPLRLRRHCDNARAVADFLARDLRVTHVSYPVWSTTSTTPQPGNSPPAGALTSTYGQS